MVYDGVRDVRHNYVTSLECDEAGEDSELEEATRSPASSPVKEKTHIREAVSRLRPEQLGAELRGADSPVYWVAVWSNPEVRNLLSTQELGGSQVDGFLEEKEKFDKEVNKWEESNNDIIVVAKHMCCIMTDMTDFIKGRGKLKTTADIIESAKRIRFQISPFQNIFLNSKYFLVTRVRDWMVWRVRLPGGVPSPRPSRTCWPTWVASPSTATSSTSPARSRQMSTKSPEN